MLGKKVNECPKCGKIYMLPSSLKTHLLSHVNDDKFTCPECLMLFKTQAQLEEHSLSHLKTYSNNGRNLSNLKTYSTSDSRSVSHLNANSDGRICDEGTLRKKTNGQVCLKSKNVSPIVGNQTGACLKELVGIYQKLLKCPKCPLTFFTKVDLENHLASHSYDIRFCVDKVCAESKSVQKAKISDMLTLEGDSVTINNSSALYGSNDNSKKFQGISFQSIKDDVGEVTANEKHTTREEIIQTIGHEDPELGIHCVKSSNDGMPFVLHSKKENEIETDSGHQLITFEIGNHKAREDCYVENDFLNTHAIISNVIPETSEKDILASCISQLSKTEPDECKMIKSSVSQMNLKYLSSNSVEYKGLATTDVSPNNFLGSSDSIDTDDEYGKGEANLSDDYCILFKCSECTMIFLSKKEIDSHVQLHTNKIMANKDALRRLEFPEQPKILENSFGSDGNEKDHKYHVGKTTERGFIGSLKEVYQKYFKCLKCPVVLSTKSKMDSHKVIHLQDQMLNFEVCAENSISDGSDRKPMENMETVDKNSEPQSCDLNSSVCSPVFQCSVCEEKFSSRTEFQGHLSVHGLEKLPDVELSKNFDKEGSSSKKKGNKCQVSDLVCIVCEKKFSNRKKYFDHIRLHRDRKFKCNVCGKKFRANSYLKKHMQVHSRPFSCDKCNKSFRTEYVLELHQALHSEARPYKCSECGNAFKHKVSLMLHNSNHVTNGPFSCEMCKMYFDDANKLKLHMKTHPTEFSDKQVHVCSKCDESFIDRDELNHHLQSHFDDKPYKCRVCSKKFSKKCLLTSHQIVHVTGNYHCRVCKKIFSSQDSLSSHMDTHSDTKKYLCYICGLTISHDWSYYLHMKKHSGVKDYHCKVCEKKFYDNKALKRHMSIHLGIKPYHCGLCDTSFRQSAHLKTHLIAHSGEKAHPCNICNKNFTQKSSLKIHQLIHSSSPYECTECNRKFTQKKSLLNHLKTRTEGKIYHCKLCEKKFTRRSCLVYHKKVHLRGTCVINFDGNKEVIETYIDVDEHKEIIVNQIDMYDPAEEIVDTLAVNIHIPNSEEVIDESVEKEASADPNNLLDVHSHVLPSQETQVLEFNPQLPHGYDLNYHLTQTFFSTSEIPEINPGSIEIQDATLDLQSFGSGCNDNQEIHFNPGGSDAVVLDPCESQMLSFSSFEPHTFIFDPKCSQNLSFLPENVPGYVIDQEEIIVSSSKDIEENI